MGYSRLRRLNQYHQIHVIAATLTSRRNRRTMLSNTRLNLLPLHRLASGLRKIYSFQKPQKNTFIHYDSQTNEEDQPDIVKCVSNILDGTPARWKEDERLHDHIENIVNSYQASSPTNADPVDQLTDWRLSEKSSSGTSVIESSPGSSVSVSPQAQLDDVSFGSGEWSAGAAGHAQGTCKPCGWNRKPGGCSKGTSCEFCHMCDDGALKRKKKDRLQRIKESKRSARKLEQAFHQYNLDSQEPCIRSLTW